MTDSTASSVETRTCARCGAPIQYVPQVDEWRKIGTGGDRCSGAEWFGYNRPPHTADLAAAAGGTQNG